MKRYCLSLLLILGLFSSAFADIITLTNGHKVDAISITWSRCGDRAKIEHPGGFVVIPREMIAKIESGSLAEIQSAILATAPK